MRYSVLLPIQNEEGSLPSLLAEIAASMAGVGEPFEVICVNDGSTDGSPAILREWGQRDRRFRQLDLPENQGQSAALWTGIRAARGEFVITLDADGQNDPADIAAMLPHLAEADAVVGWRKNRQDTATTRLASSIANAVRNAVTGESIRDTGCGLKIMRRDMLLRVPPFHGMHRFLPTLLRMRGARVKETPVSHRPRRTGRSHYGILDRAWRGLWDLLAVRWMGQRLLPVDTRPGTNATEPENPA